ncbi:MAG: SMC family ATPase [Synergistaceae bacterium]|jgi:exonuclease SbcC|nr:SMC family ATPase [Synergistaceae bacterium]
MKPLKLTMSAFGSYAGTENIDFTKLGANGLYLVTGETGSGKTTIFDAISYALFGETSGNDRLANMMHSDYANVKDKTFVELEFVASGAQYKIRREIVLHISRKTGEVSHTTGVALTLPDGTIIDRDRDVRAKITEAVGLDRDQFAQIIMIAQNDFLRFLKSDTKGRVEILRRIFGTEKLQKFQDDLKLLASAKKNEYDIIVGTFTANDVDVHNRAAVFAEWGARIGASKSELAVAERTMSENDESFARLTADIATAEILAKAFDELTTQRANLVKHLGQAEEITALRERQKLGEKSLRHVKPLADKSSEAKTAHGKAAEELSEAIAAAETAQTSFEAAKKSVSELPDLEAAQEAHTELSRQTDEAANRFKAITSLKADSDVIAGKKKLLDEIKRELSELETAIAALPSLSEAQEELTRLNNSLASELERLDTVEKLSGGFAEITSKRKALTAQQAEFEKLNDEFKLKDTKYRALYDRFLSGQAGILARTLADGEPCPVCGSREHPAPAAAADEDISESKLKKLNADAEMAKAALEDCGTKCAAARAEIVTLASRFNEDAESIIPDFRADDAGSMLSAARTELHGLVDSLTTSAANAQRSFDELKDTTEKKISRRDKLKPESGELSAEIATLTERFIRELGEHIPGVTYDTAGSELSGLLEAAEELSSNLSARQAESKKSLAKLKSDSDAAKKALADSDKTLEAANALASERRQREAILMNQRNDALAAFESSLRENDFSDESAYSAALVSENELSEWAKEIAKYEETGKQVGRDIKRLESETAGKSRPDLEKLDGEVNAVKAVGAELTAKRDALIAQINETTRKLNILRDAAQSLAKAEKEYLDVGSLSIAANGKLNFETYAQTAYFERVLAAANKRLKLMSQSRYTLLRKADSSDRRKSTGLELEILDSFTGKARSANSLSGGESFMASLSLALGLSDVVQHSAGGVHLDAMFIDEGFGSLDADTLDLAVRTLAEMAGTNRIIGIISHVAELRERIDTQIRVEKTQKGSKISLAV